MDDWPFGAEGCAKVSAAYRAGQPPAQLIIWGRFLSMLHDGFFEAPPGFYGGIFSFPRPHPPTASFPRKRELCFPVRLPSPHPQSLPIKGREAQAPRPVFIASLPLVGR